MIDLPQGGGGMKTCEHDWSADWDLVKGLRENPGVWGIGGAAIRITEVCTKCLTARNKIIGDVDYPSRNHDWTLETKGERFMV